MALHDFGNGNAFGLFLGPGASAAESWVKAGPTWRITPRPGPLPGLGGVSCRWRPVPAHRGVVLCVIVDPAGPADADGLVGVQAAIEAVVSTATASPFGDIERMVPPLFPALSSLRMEMRSQPFGRRWARAVKAVIGAFILGGVHRLGGHLGPLDVDAYRHACAERTDYRKLSGGPRLVLDVTLDEAERIEAILTQAEQAGLIRFGTARADATTMTCLVGDFSADRHIHFVDGADLGFWRAATVLKRKMAAKRVFAEGENPG